MIFSCLRNETPCLFAKFMFNFEKGLGANPEEVFSLMPAADPEGYLPLDLAMPDSAGYNAG